MKTGLGKVEYIGSFPGYEKMPVHDKPEFCFIGRSNVGKSSLLNYLSGQNSLARTSKKPGKTQSLNLYLNHEGFYYVDLPGYGFANTSKAERDRWKKMIYNYLEKRKNLALCFVLLDSRISFQQIDKDFINWTGEKSIPIALVFTKTDAVKSSMKSKHISQVKKDLLLEWDHLPEIFEVSSEDKIGGETLLEYITQIIETLRI
ncbi:MAG: ribosome biogenesis GTP-binding protein YihA/YsxC [Deltaproteobacteria bacterium]